VDTGIDQLRIGWMFCVKPGIAGEITKFGSEIGTGLRLHRVFRAKLSGLNLSGLNLSGLNLANEAMRAEQVLWIKLGLNLPHQAQGIACISPDIDLLLECLRSRQHR